MDTAPIRLKDWLPDSGLTIAALAAKAEVSASQMSLIVNGKRRPSPETAELLQGITGIDARHLLGIAVPKEAA